MIPKPGGRVQVVNGEHRRKQGTVRTIDVDKFCVVVDLDPEASDRGCVTSRARARFASPMSHQALGVVTRRVCRWPGHHNGPALRTKTSASWRRSRMRARDNWRCPRRAAKILP